MRGEARPRRGTVTERQRQVLDSWLRGEPVADTCDRLRISRQRYYQLLRAALRRAAEELRKRRGRTGR
jgi:DNA-binding CsgD family transcriptional regulator